MGGVGQWGHEEIPWWSQKRTWWHSKDRGGNKRPDLVENLAYDKSGSVGWGRGKRDE